MKSMKIKKWSIRLLLPIVFTSIAIMILFSNAIWEMIKNASCHSKYNDLTPLDWEDGDMIMIEACMDTYIRKYSAKVNKGHQKYNIDDMKDFSGKFIKNENNIPVFVKYYCDEFLTRSAARSNEVCISFNQHNDLMKNFEDHKSSLQDNNDLEKDNNNKNSDNTDFINKEDNSNKNHLNDSNADIDNKNDIHSNEKDKNAIDKKEEFKAEISKEVQELNTKIMELENKIKDF